MRKLTGAEMKSVLGGALDYMGCFDYNGGLLCCMGCSGSYYCGTVEWYFEVDPDPGLCT